MAEASSASCSGCSCSTSVGAAPPAHFRAAAQRAEPGAGHVGEHPAERAGAPGRSGAVRDDHARRVDPVGPDRLPDQHGPVRCDLRREESAAAGAGQSGEQRGLASGTGAEIQPRTGRRVGAGQSPGDELGTLVLHPGPALAHRGKVGGVAGPAGGERRVESRLGPGRDQLPDLGQSRPDRQADLRAEVVGRQRRLELGGRQQVGVRVDDPPRMRGAQREPIMIIEALARAGPASLHDQLRPPGGARR